MQPTEVITRAVQLKNDWSVRNRKFKEWYNILKLTDEMEEDNMESFVSNNPKTFYDLSLHLLTPKPIPHRFPVEGLSEKDIEATSKVEGILMNEWRQQDLSYRRLGKQSKIRQLAGHILKYGWYAIQVGVDNTGFQADVWHPVETFPFWGDEELLEVAHVYTLKNKAAKMKLKQMGKTFVPAQLGDLIIYDYWFIDDDGDVCHAIANSLNTFMLQPEKRKDLQRIPVILGPVGGLAEDSVMDVKWQEGNGASLVDTNASLYRNYNRVKTFMQQAVRDATEPKWFERSTGTEILDEVGMRSRGAIFRGGPQDSVDALTYPPIPIELSMNLADYSQQIQQGSFSPMMFGNVMVQVAAYTLSQMAQAAQQVLRPYHEAMQDALAEVDNFWLFQAQARGFSPKGIVIPALPAGLEINVDYPIAIPGDLINRATVAKMLSPSLELSQDTVMDTLFSGEVLNPLAEQAKARKDKAMQSDISIMVDQVIAFRGAAALARDNKNDDMERLYTGAADAIEAQITGMGQPQPQPAPAQGGPPMGIQQATTETVPPGIEGGI